MKFLWLKLLPLFLGFVLFGGCESKFKITGVNVTITDFRPAGASAPETQAAVTLRFTNENIVPVAIAGGVYSLYLNNTYIGKSVSELPVGLAPTSTDTKTVTVTIENLALIRSLQGLGQANSVSYRLESVLRINVGDDHLSAKSTSSGALDLSGFRPASP